MVSKELPTVGTRTKLDLELKTFLSKNPELHLGGIGDFHEERSDHTKVFGFHSLPKGQQAPIQSVEFTAIRGPHGTIPLRIFYPKSGEGRKRAGDAGALIYFHGGGYTIGTVYAVEYRLALEWRFPTQLDEYVAVAEWLHGSGGKERGVSSEKVMGGGDSAGGNMTTAVSLRLRDEGKKPLVAQILLYPEARLPFDTPAASENNSELYLEYHYLPRGTPPTHKYVSPGIQSNDTLKNVPPAAVFTCGFDPLRDVGVEYGTKLKQAGNQVA
ncbi:uncharacterized protein PAC_02695 [Phialocephala subalpina]|uniref:Alpha/beta hydrolase fold-3 domain-containing protein n=1 Tax=Phialocephala subalpina TaxID=576137 RepID=A0A1L7WJ96_9HELO|nr:uncharacterized protein PAC_02695 [Phialocephala subalpina]